MRGNPVIARRMIRNARKFCGKSDSFPRAKDRQAWDDELEALMDLVLWDRDFELGDEVIDLPPVQSSQIQDFMGFGDQYFIAVPADPRDIAPHITRVTRYMRTPYKEFQFRACHAQ